MYIGSIGGFLFGYDLGVISQALPLLTNQFSLSIEQQELFSSLILAGQIFGSLMGGYICDKIGRKGTIFFVCIIFIIGSCILTFADELTTLYVGRFIVGIGVAISAIADVSYLTEVSPDRHRGAMVGANELMITIGLLGAYIFGFVLSGSIEGWRRMFALPIFISVIWMIMMFFLPESPKWLLIQGKVEKAQAVYNDRVDTESEAQEDFQNACDQVAKAKEAEKLSLFEIIHFWRYSIITSILILLAQNLSGHISVLTYAPAIFKAAGFGRQGAGIATIVLGVIKVIFTFTSMNLVDAVGRKSVLMTGIVGIIVSLIGIISSVETFSIDQSGADDDSGDASAVAGGSGVITSVFVCILVASFALGYGPLSWLISSELFPDDIRGRALGMVTIANGLGSLVAVSSFLSMVAALGAQLTFAVYLVSQVVKVVVVI